MTSHHTEAGSSAAVDPHETKRVVGARTRSARERRRSSPGRRYTQPMRAPENQGPDPELAALAGKLGQHRGRRLILFVLLLTALGLGGRALWLQHQQPALTQLDSEPRAPLVAPEPVRKPPVKVAAGAKGARVRTPAPLPPARVVTTRPQAVVSEVRHARGLEARAQALPPAPPVPPAEAELPSEPVAEAVKSEAVAVETPESQEPAGNGEAIARTCM